MPLTVYNEDDHAFDARRVFDLASDSVQVRRRANADMGGFFMANLAQPTALATQGAAGCQIIIVHKRPGLGALGHYAGTDDPHEILWALEQMVDKLGRGPIDSVVYSAGTGVSGPMGQKAYEFTIFGGTRLRFPGATVLWPPQPKSNFGSAMYLPLTGEVALFHDFPRAFDGGVPRDGVSPHDYYLKLG